MTKNLDLHDLKAKIELKLRKGHITSRVLLGRSRFMDEASIQSSPFNDSSLFPFYYHLGKYLCPEQVVEFGTGLGLRAACLVQGYNLKRYLGFQVLTEGFYSTRLTYANIHDHTTGKVEICKVKFGDVNTYTERLKDKCWDLAIIAEECDYDNQMRLLELAWDSLIYDGMIVVDYYNRHLPCKKALDDFSSVKKRELVVIATRYGVGLLQK